MLNIPIQPGERDVLVEAIDEWLDGADETEKGFYRDKLFEEPETFLRVMDDHKTRTGTLRELKERLTNA